MFSQKNKATPCFICRKPSLDEENELTWDVIRILITQLRPSFAGFAGFDLNMLPVIFKAKCIPEDEWDVILEKIMVVTRIAYKYHGAKDKK